MFRNSVKSFLSVISPSLAPLFSARNWFSTNRVISLILHEVHDIDGFALFVDRVLSSFPAISPDEFEENRIRNKKMKTPHVLFTFDDGFESSYIATKSVLEPRGIKAAFFICPDFVDTPASQVHKFVKNNFELSLPDQAVTALSPMTWDQIRALHQSGHKIGSHTLSHARLSRLLSDRDRHKEIVLSGDKIEKELGSPVRWFAYPFGDVKSVDASSFEFIKNRYDLCFSGVRGSISFSDSPYALKRQALDPNNSWEKNQLILQGGLSPFYLFDRMKLSKFSS